MADERLLSVDEFLLTLIVKVMYQSPNLTSTQVARLATNRSAHPVGRRKVDAILTQLSGGLVSVAGVPPSQVVRGRARGVFRRAVRWSLVQVPASGYRPDASGAPVPARPLLSSTSGAAAVSLTFRDDAPPPNAFGRIL